MTPKVIYKTKDMVINGKLQDKDKTVMDQEEMIDHKTSDSLDKSLLWLDKRTTITTCHLVDPPSPTVANEMMTSIFHLILTT